jgi:hypothetical protein
MSTASERLKKRQAEQTKASIMEGFAPLVNQELPLPLPKMTTPDAEKITKSKQLAPVEVPESTANRLRVKCAQLNTTQARAIQSLVEAWINDEITIDLNKAKRPLRTRNGVAVNRKPIDLDV